MSSINVFSASPYSCAYCVTLFDGSAWRESHGISPNSTKLPSWTVCVFHFCSEQRFALSASKVQQDPFFCSKNSSCTVRIRINMNQLHDVDYMSNTAVLSNCQTVFLETKECKWMPHRYGACRRKCRRLNSPIAVSDEYAQLPRWRWAFWSYTLHHWESILESFNVPCVAPSMEYGCIWCMVTIPQWESKHDGLIQALNLAALHTEMILVYTSVDMCILVSFSFSALKACRP